MHLVRWGLFRTRRYIIAIEAHHLDPMLKRIYDAGFEDGLKKMQDLHDRVEAADVPGTPVFRSVVIFGHRLALSVEIDGEIVDAGDAFQFSPDGSLRDMLRVNVDKVHDIINDEKRWRV